MNKLQEEIEQALLRQDTLDYVGMSKAASEVTLKWIEKAFDAGEKYGFADGYGVLTNEKPKKNG
jgi:hypothetical protein